MRRCGGNLIEKTACRNSQSHNLYKLKDKLQQIFVWVTAVTRFGRVLIRNTPDDGHRPLLGKHNTRIGKAIYQLPK